VLRSVALVVAGVIAGGGTVAYLKGPGGGMVGPMPAPTPATPASPDGPAVGKVQRLEIVDGSGKLMFAVGVENGKAVAVVNDNGTARTIDLARVARLAR
jgi:hypothetical protein